MVPTEYEFQKNALERGLINGEKINRLEAGAIGENKLYRYLKEFGQKHWVILRNVWFHGDSPFECDLLLITRHQSYAFEVKNYYGKFIYQNGQCSSRGVSITYNPINQARNAAIHLENITSAYSRSIPVKGVLVFIGEHNQVHIRDEIDYIDILQTNDVYQFIQEMIHEEKKTENIRIDSHDLAAYYLSQQIGNPYQSLPFTKEELIKAKTGIFCANCRQKVEVKRDKYIICPCGLHESKEEAIIRTACDYGVLTYGEDFTVGDIRRFIENKGSYDYFKKILSRHFQSLPNTKMLTFKNMNREFDVLSQHFTFKWPKMMTYS